jgi:hypothetical protein
MVPCWSVLTRWQICLVIGSIGDEKGSFKDCCRELYCWKKCSTCRGEWDNHVLRLKSCCSCEYLENALETAIDERQHLGRNLAVELGPRNITTNVVAPGFFPSKLASGLIEKLGGTVELSEANPRKRLGEPEDIAGVMVYLCSPAGSYMYVPFAFILFAVIWSNRPAEMVLISLLMGEWSCHLAGIPNYKQSVFFHSNLRGYPIKMLCTL